VFERFTERARQVVVLAQDEARRLQHGYIGTEHLLLGLIREEQGIAARVLALRGVELEAARSQVTQMVGHGGEPVTAPQLPLTPRLNNILHLSLREAAALRHDYIGTEHLLIALLREGGGVALNLLRQLGVSPEQVWDDVYRQLGAAEVPPLSQPVGATVSPASGGDEERWAALFEWWVPLVGGVGIFGAGLFSGWLIWG
jgi:ATP-dependent Clp protease ATP-binding subunit ClpC